MSRYIEADEVLEQIRKKLGIKSLSYLLEAERQIVDAIQSAPSIDIVRCKECRKSHIDGKTTHYLWCTEWGRSTDTYGYCERGERESE